PLDEPIVRLAVFRRDHHGFVAAHEAGARKNDRFQQVALGTDGPDLRQIGPDVAAAITDLVAGETGRFGAVEDKLPASDVSVLGRSEQLFEMSNLLGMVCVYFRIKFYRLLLDARGILDDSLLDGGDTQAGSNWRLGEDCEQVDADFFILSLREGLQQSIYF